MLLQEVVALEQERGAWSTPACASSTWRAHMTRRATRGSRRDAPASPGRLRPARMRQRGLIGRTSSPGRESPGCSEIKEAATLVGLLGWPTSQSLSPPMQNAACAALGLDWAYVPLPTPPELLGDAVRGLRAVGFAGANVRSPQASRARALRRARRHRAGGRVGGTPSSSRRTASSGPRPTVTRSPRSSRRTADASSCSEQAAPHGPSSRRWSGPEPR